MSQSLQIPQRQHRRDHNENNEKPPRRHRGCRPPQLRLLGRNSSIVGCDDGFFRRLQKIYGDATTTSTTNKRALTDFWTEYTVWVGTVKNLDDSQSQIEYWDGKKRFNELNNRLKRRDRPPIPLSYFQPPLPHTVGFLETMASQLVETKFRLTAYFQLILLIAQFALNVTFITRQFQKTVTFTPGPKMTDGEYLRSAAALGHLIEFSILAIHLLIGFVQLIIFFRSHSVLNKGISFQNLVTAIQKTATFSLFKFIHYMNPSTFVTEFHDPPFLDSFSDLVKFTFNRPEWEPIYCIIHKVLYSVVTRPILIFLGLLALYVKLVQVSSTLNFLSNVSFTITSFLDLFKSSSGFLNFLGLANNVAGLYGLQPEDDRKAFFDHLRINEHDFIHALLVFFDVRHELWRGYLEVVLYSVGIRGRELNITFWECVYGGQADIYGDGSVAVKDNAIDLEAAGRPMPVRKKSCGGTRHRYYKQFILPLFKSDHK